MLDLLYDIKITLKLPFWRENVKIMYATLLWIYGY